MLKELLTQAAEVGYNFDIRQFPGRAVPFHKNEAIQQIVAAAVKLAQDDFTNLTQTIGMVDPFGNAMPLQSAYRACIDYAFEQVFTGAADYNTAIRRATKNLAKMGVRVIDYESGVHTSLEAAVRRNIMGGLGLMNEKIEQQNHDDLGCDGWEISAHANSAPDHEPIQGRQYSDAEYEALNNSLVRRIGTLNCGHAAFPIILGVNSPQYTPEELEKFRADNEKGVTIDGRRYTMYEATQMQRRIERSIRTQKRRILVDESAGDQDKLLTDRIRFQRLRQEYKRFSRAAGLRTEPERARVTGFGRGQAMSAEKYGNIVSEQIGHSVGAKARNYDVFNPATGDIFHLAEGTRITQPKNHVMAGSGRDRQIDCLDWLIDKYGGEAVKWTKEKGFGFIEDEYGELRRVELHWYQEPNVGKVEMKIKVRDGRWYLDD